MVNIGKTYFKKVAGFTNSERMFGNFPIISKKGLNKKMSFWVYNLMMNKITKSLMDIVNKIKRSKI